MTAATLPYEDTQPDQRAHLYPSDAPDVAAAFDREVLPHLIDPARFLALEPIVRLRATADFATVHPDKHRQSVWAAYAGDATRAIPEGTRPIAASLHYVTFPVQLPPVDAALSCGTSHCLAGWGCHFVGYAWATEVCVGETTPPITAARLSLSHQIHHVLDADGARIGPAEAAAKLFGLSSEDADYLFGATLDIDDLREAVAMLERGEDLAGIEDACTCGCQS